jgi:hypothetical protein
VLKSQDDAAYAFTQYGHVEVDEEAEVPFAKLKVAE